MGKIARIVSIEFESAEARRSTQKKFREVMSELAPGLELIAVVNTDETSAMTIQIWPNQETLDAFEQKMIDWVEENMSMHTRDRIAYEGDLDFWFQQIKYSSGDTSQVSGAGA